MMKKRAYAEYAIIKILEESNRPIECRELIFKISQMNKSFAISSRLIGIIASKNERIHKTKISTNLINTTYYSID